MKIKISIKGQKEPIIYSGDRIDILDFEMNGEKLAQATDTKQLGFAFLGYLIFTVFMTVGAMETHKVLFTIFVLIDFLFIGLSLNAFGIMPELTHGIAAWSELLIAIMSFYGSGAAVLNKHFGKVFLPVGKPFGIFKK